LLFETAVFGPALFFEDMPEVFETFSFFLDRLPSKEKITRAEIWISVENEIIKMLIENANKVLEEKALLEAAKVYVRCLVSPNVSFERDIAKGLLLEARIMIRHLLEKNP
jgi:hypothetical protein